jgi:hypothetical protein
MADRHVTQSAAEADRIGLSEPNAGPPWPSATTSRVGCGVQIFDHRPTSALKELSGTIADACGPRLHLRLPAFRRRSTRARAERRF